jgi:hypothetical protein
MTSQKFLELSTELFQDLRHWIEEASKLDGLSPSDLALLTSAANIVERVTLRETELKPQTPN